MSSTSSNNLPVDLQNVAVVLRFDRGDFEHGFSVTLEVYSDGKPVCQEPHYELPPAPALPQLYQQWASDYNNLGHLEHLNMAPIEPVAGQITHHDAIGDCQRSAGAVQNSLIQWFNHDKFTGLSLRVQAKEWVKRDRSVPILFNFATRNPEVNNLLRKLPWHLWQLFRELDQAEVVLSIGARPNSIKLKNPVRVLAIFGSDRGGLNLEHDKQALRDILIPQEAIIEFVEQPTVEQLHNCLRNEKGWDILFFTGHSTSDLEDGHLLISEETSIPLSVLEDDFRVALRNGLKLAIFNSCKGLGIADFFVGWSRARRFKAIPNVIVMREPVPDFVARRFFREFLSKFVAGEPIARAVREARGRLTVLDHYETLDSQTLERCKTPYPCASWIPVICLSPSQPELVWPLPEPEPEPEPEPKSLDISKWLKVGGGVAAAAAALLVGWLAIDKIIFDQSLGSSLERENISLGEDLLIPPTVWTDSQAYRTCSNNSNFKEEGIAEFGEENWAAAIELFEDFRNTCKLDPETLIYLNNAKTLQQSTQEVIRIAVVVPTGDRDTVGPAQEVLRGPALVQKEINENGGVDGRLIQIQIVNDTSGEVNTVSDRTEEIARALSNDPAVVAVVGSFTSLATREAADIYKENGLVSISPTSTAVRDGNFFLDEEYAFRASPTDARAAEDFVSIIQEQEYESIGIIYQSKDDYSQSLKRQSEGKIAQSPPDIEIVAPDVCDISSDSFSPNRCITSELADVDAILMLLSTEFHENLREIALTIDDLSQKPALFGGDAVFGGGTLGEVGKEVEGMLVSIPWHQSIDSGQATSFPKKAQEIWGTSNINWRTAFAYDAAQAIVGAVNQMNVQTEGKDGILTREDIEGLKDTLKESSFDGFLGSNTIKFNESGDRELDGSLGLGTIVEVKCSGQENSSCAFVKPD